MSHNPTSGCGIDDVYRSVIADVVVNLREMFLDENVDVEVLHALKKEWEEKLSKTAAANLDNANKVPPPAIRSAFAVPSSSHFVMRPAPLPIVRHAPPQAAAASGWTSATTPLATPAAQAPPQQPHLKNAKRELAQLDGGPGMTDSSSSEEEEEDPIKHYMGLDDKADEGETVDEDPLNSADDQSDEEDLETLFDADNVVVCQFEKVNRARTKWKFTLKDGIMHLNGKDYCFQKGTGEAEW